MNGSFFLCLLARKKENCEKVPSNRIESPGTLATFGWDGTPRACHFFEDGYESLLYYPSK